MRSETLRWSSMTRLNAKNNAETVLAQAVSESDTTFIVEDAGALPNAPFRLSIEDEIVEVSAVDGNALTVERAVEDTQAGSYDVGTAVENRLTAGMWNEMGSSIPKGIITMWSGSENSIPNGWALCNGENETPDLTNRFIVGAGGEYSVGDVGGYEKVKLTGSEMPSHNHLIDEVTEEDGGHTHAFGVLGPVPGGQGSPPPSYAKGSDWEFLSVDDSTEVSGAHTHKIFGYTRYAGGSQAHENRPPYYALAYIMKL